MSDVSKTIPKLIAEARTMGTEDRADNADMIDRLAAALESATRVPEQGEASEGRAMEIARELARVHTFTTVDALSIANAALALAAPDAATAAIERVRGILASDELDGPEHDDWVFRDEAERKLAEIDAALDGAPEPEFEWGHDCDESRATHGASESPQNEWGAMGTCVNVTNYRRRKAGPWLPVEGESA